MLELPHKRRLCINMKWKCSKASEGETAMKEIMNEIRRLIDAGEVEIIVPSDEDETETSET